MRQRELRVLLFWAANRCLERAIILCERAKFRIGVLAMKLTLTAALRIVRDVSTETGTVVCCERLDYLSNSLHIGKRIYGAWPALCMGR